MNKHSTTTNASTERPGTLGGLKDSVRGLVDKGGQRAGEIKTRVIEVKDEAMIRGTAVADRAAMLIKANPMKAVGIAFGLGYLGMRIFRR